MPTNAVVIHPRDNVAVAIMEIQAGEAVAAAGVADVKAREKIMRNHKIAIAEIPENAPVVKYGETIGFASTSIREGNWIHTHNLKSQKA